MEKKSSSSKSIKINNTNCEEKNENQENPVKAEKKVGCSHYKRRAKFVVS